MSLTLSAIFLSSVLPRSSVVWSCCTMRPRPLSCALNPNRTGRVPVRQRSRHRSPPPLYGAPVTSRPTPNIISATPACHASRPARAITNLSSISPRSRQLLMTLLFEPFRLFSVNFRSPPRARGGPDPLGVLAPGHGRPDHHRASGRRGRARWRRQWHLDRAWTGRERCGERGRPPSAPSWFRF